MAASRKRTWTQLSLRITKQNTRLSLRKRLDANIHNLLTLSLEGSKEATAVKSDGEVQRGISLSNKTSLGVTNESVLSDGQFQVVSDGFALADSLFPTWFVLPLVLLMSVQMHLSVPVLSSSNDCQQVLHFPIPSIARGRPYNSLKVRRSLQLCILRARKFHAVADTVSSPGSISNEAAFTSNSLHQSQRLGYKTSICASTWTRNSLLSSVENGTGNPLGTPCDVFSILRGPPYPRNSTCRVRRGAKICVYRCQKRGLHKWTSNVTDQSLIPRLM